MSIFGSVPEVTPTKSEQLTANRLVEDHIRLYGYVQHPDKLKDAIAQDCVDARNFFGLPIPPAGESPALRRDFATSATDRIQ